MRDSFVFYRSFYESIKELEPITQAEIYNAIFEYSLNFNLIELNGISKSIFTLIKPQIDANNKKYQNGKLGAEHGNKGGRPPKKLPTETPQKPQENPTETPNENDNENDNENIYINSENLTDTEKQLKAFTEVLETQTETKKEFQDLPKYLNIDTEYYIDFLDKWNAYGSKYKNRQVKLKSLQQLDKHNLKNINLSILEISKGLLILFNQKDIIESCLVTPKHFLNDFAKYYQAGLEYEKTNIIIQFYQPKNK